ncbi:MAG: hypothetical protein ACJ8GN_28685 [Longimicrobiaceae bacterium]
MDTSPQNPARPPQAPPPAFERPVLVVAHPGHELRVYGWLESAAPLVCVLTDGSGSGGEARLESTTRLLAGTGARPGAIYGRMSDREIYTAILDRDFACFTELAEQLAGELDACGADCVAGDAVEGYNPSHDVCRLVINAALRLLGRTVPAYDFALVGAPDGCPEALRAQALWMDLDEAALARKLAAARSYEELAGEVEHALARFGVAPFRTECLRPVDLSQRYVWDPAEVPYYETYGEKRVAEGAYDRVLRFGEHVRPLADALWEHGERHG